MSLPLADILLLSPYCALLVCSIILSIKTRFIQVRAFPRIFSLLKRSIEQGEETTTTIAAHKALFAAMATTIGIGNITGPLIAIGMGGPGALVGFFLATLFGSASTFVEVTYARTFPDPAPRAERIGGPMFYLNKVYPHWVGTLYAGAGAILLLAWTGAQSVNLAQLLTPYHIPPLVCGCLLALVTLIVLSGGIKRFSEVANNLVPAMFILYIGAVGYILLSNYEAIPHAFGLIFQDCFSTTGLKGGVAGFGLAHMMRWGLARGFSSNESGIGTTTIPHSFAESENAVSQGLLSIASVFSNGLLCISTGLAILTTNTHLQYGENTIGLITELFARYFPFFGPLILIMSALLFVVTTALGNSYNGSQFFVYAYGKKQLSLYYLLTLTVIVISSVASVSVIFDIVDYLTIPVIIPHCIGLVLIAYKIPYVIESATTSDSEHKS